MRIEASGLDLLRRACGGLPAEQGELLARRLEGAIRAAAPGRYAPEAPRKAFSFISGPMFDGFGGFFADIHTFSTIFSGSYCLCSCSKGCCCSGDLKES